MRALCSRRNVFLLASVTCLGLLLLQGLAGSSSHGISSSVAPPEVNAKPRTHAHSEAGQSNSNAHTLSAGEANVLFAAARRTADASRAADLFAPKSWYVPPPPPPPAPPAPAAAPTAPPLPYTFVGSYDDGSHSTVYFITRDERVYDVRPGDTVDQIYTVDAVENGQLIFTYRPMNVRQSLPIGAGP